MINDVTRVGYLSNHSFRPGSLGVGGKIKKNLIIY